MPASPRQAHGRRLPARLRVAAGSVLLLSALVPASAQVPVLASHTPGPSAVTIAGSLQSELGCPGDWEPDCAATHLTLDATDAVWQGTFTVPAGDWAVQGAAQRRLGRELRRQRHRRAARTSRSRSARRGASSSTTTTRTHWVTDNVSSVIAVAPGSFQSRARLPRRLGARLPALVAPGPDGDGTYTFETTALPAGSLRDQGRDQRVAGTRTTARAACPAARTSPSPSRRTTRRSPSPTTPRPTSSIGRRAGHGHDGNVEWDGLRHDSRDDALPHARRRGPGRHARHAPLPHLPRRRHRRHRCASTTSTPAAAVAADGCRRRERRVLLRRRRSRASAATSGA